VPKPSKKQREAELKGAKRKVSAAWWNNGHALGGRDSTKPENQGLSHREQMGMAAENDRPWGRSFAASAIKGRHEHKLRDEGGGR
jgi:hypothetical protein